MLHLIAHPCQVNGTLSLLFCFFDFTMPMAFSGHTVEAAMQVASCMMLCTPHPVVMFDLQVNLSRKSHAMF